MVNKYSRNDSLQIPAMMIPGFRSTLAIQNGVEKNLLFRTWGGLGDQICAEPTLRYALKTFSKNCNISIASEQPEFFSHLKFKEVFDLKKEVPEYGNYLVFETITPPNDTNLVWQFFSHMLTNCVDFPSMCALRLQLPVPDKEVHLADVHYLVPFYLSRTVVIHAGRHWPSKTFPKQWWDEVIATLVANDYLVVLIGGNTDDNRGTVDVDASRCIDLRNELSLMETVSLLKQSKCLITNDSAPLHMAVDSNCHIGFIATVKHPDYIRHWRRGEWSWRMENLSKGGMWDITDHAPNSGQNIEVDKVDESYLKSWLPTPDEVLWWVKTRK